MKGKINMNKIYGFTGKSLNFWLGLFSFAKEDGIENFCKVEYGNDWKWAYTCLLYTSPSPRDLSTSRMPSSA